ncbi:hypothetical protein [Arthrobacter sp. 162MFSha1.1]|uniref:hypothetical protein n=1 Tax=Arthrobacter sp. 162MFSha1.1 TaxID=1151119 RepID=UPI000370E0E3|nr:hypothetical protein [Arthrobacter sp. 162MFSha1.1]
MNADQLELRDANWESLTDEARKALHAEKLQEAIAGVPAGDSRQVTVELDISEYGHRDDLREIGTISMQEAAALTYYLEYHRDYDYSRAALVRVEDFGPLGFDQMNDDDMYPAPHDLLSGEAHGILNELRIFLDCYWENDQCFVKYRIH